MRTSHVITIVVLSAVLGAFGQLREAQAMCDTSQLCPGVAPAPCGISGKWNIDDGCDLDFTGRNVSISANSTLDIGGGTVTIHAKDFTVLTGGLIDGRPEGGVISVFATGNILVQNSVSKGIDVAGDSLAGDILLNADGDITIEGRLRAHNSTIDASGGTIGLSAGGDIVITATSAVDASGGGFDVGGALDFTAGGTINILKDLTVKAGDGGTVDMVAGNEIIISGKLLGNGDNGGEGGFIDLSATNNVTIGREIQSRGSGAGEFGGGDGGEILIASERGDVLVRAEVTARSGSPDGGGGGITLTAGKSIDIQSAGKLNVAGDGLESYGGAVELFADLDVIIGGRVDASGGDGGEVDIAAGRDVDIRDTNVDAGARAPFGFGGTIFIDAADITSGELKVNGTIDATAGPCADGWCGAGGEINLSACDVTVGLGGALLVSAPGQTDSEGGSNSITARRSLTVSGTLDATAAVPGTNSLVFPSSRPPNLGGSTIAPKEKQVACSEDKCTGECRQICVDLCDCGDGTLQQFESCDTTPDGCDTGAGEVCGVTGTNLECTCIDTCGNGVVNPGEMCEEGVGEQNCLALGYANDEPAPCVNCASDVSACDEGVCGDAIIATARGEVCEGTNLNGESCLSLGYTRGQLACGLDCKEYDESDCTIGYCGDAIPDVGEECDAGGANSDAPNAACRTDCSERTCGDGIVDNQFGEQCDDGNRDNGDACLNSCLAATCGDGIVCSASNCSSGPGGGPEECDESAVCCLSECKRRVCADQLVCKPTSGCCHPDESCDDGNPCTEDTCNTFVGCAHTPIAGCCVTDGKCTDGNPCTQDRCNTNTHTCENLPQAGVCDDGNACTENDTCTNGTCGGTPVVCQSADRCLRAVSCDPVSGCQFERIVGCCSQDGDPCDDGNKCTTDDICNGDQCRGTDITCSSDDLCMQVTSCDPTIGCQFEKIPGCCLRHEDCDDDNVCTTDTCDVGTRRCQPGAQIACVSNDACMIPDGCDPVAGCRFAPLSLSGVDGLECLLNEDVVKLGAELDTLGAVDKKKKKIAKQLQRFVKRARKKIDKAHRVLANAKKAGKQLKQADKQVTKLLKKLAKYVQKNKIDAAEGGVISGQAEIIQKAVLEAMKQLGG